MRKKSAFAVEVFALMVLFALFGSIASAHHSRAHYGDEESTTRGIVVEYKWRNPHVFVVWEVRGQDGKVTQWVGEMASVTSMIADGMTKNSLKPGDEIIVLAYPSRNPGSTEALIRKITKADGTIVVDNSRSGRNIRQP
jgi:hypothetical protein